MNNQNNLSQAIRFLERTIEKLEEIGITGPLTALRHELEKLKSFKV